MKVILYALAQNLAQAHHHRLAFISALHRLHEETTRLLHGQYRLSTHFFSQLVSREAVALEVRPGDESIPLSAPGGVDEVETPISAVVVPVEKIDLVPLGNSRDPSGRVKAENKPEQRRLYTKGCIFISRYLHDNYGIYR